MLRFDVVNEHTVEIINDSNLLSVCRDVNHSDGRSLFDDRDRETVVDEDLEDTAVLETYQDSLSLRGPTHGLHVADVRIQHPLSFESPVEGQQLDFLLEY